MTIINRFTIDRIELNHHLLKIFLRKVRFRNELINEITSFSQELINQVDVLDMFSYQVFLTKEREIVRHKVIDIAMITLIAIDNFRLVLLMCSTKKSPKLICFRLLNLRFCTLSETMGTQKERARMFACTVSSFCEMFVNILLIFNENAHIDSVKSLTWATCVYLMECWDDKLFHIFKFCAKVQKKSRI